MIDFLKYVQPIWYYRLCRQSSAATLMNARFVDYKQVENCPSYQTEIARINDIAWQALNIGYIPTPSEAIPSSEIIVAKHVGDNYLFIRRHYGIQWFFYILFLRLLTFHNPIREIKAFLKHLRATPAIKLPKPERLDYANFNSDLIKSSPMVSIIIPTLNRYTYLKDVLDDLEKQTYQHLEVLICDQSNPFDAAFYENRTLNLKVIQQEEKALWLARNRCIEASNGSYILLFDDDSRVEPNWVKQHLKCLDYFGASISAGVTETLVGHGLSKKETYFHLSDVFDTGNAMVKKEVFEKTGLFDRQFEKQRMGDGEFGLRAYLEGYQVISNPFAKRVHLKVETGGLRQMGSWDAFRTQKWTAPRPIPSVLYLARRYFGKEAAIWLLCMNIPPSVIPYRFKKHKILRYFSTFLFIFVSPVVLFQVYKSWKLSSIKLLQGPAISQLKDPVSISPGPILNG